MENYSRLLEYFFASGEEMDKARLPGHMKDRLLRLRAVYSYWLNNPLKPQKDVVAMLRDTYGLTQSSAYADLAVIKSALGEFNQCTPNYLRWLFLQRCEEGFRRALDNNDANAYSRVLATFGKYTRLDKDDAEMPDYSAIQPEVFAVSADPEVAGYHRIPDLEKKTRDLLKKYSVAVESEDVEDGEETAEYSAPEEENET